MTQLTCPNCSLFSKAHWLEFQKALKAEDRFSHGLILSFVIFRKDVWNYSLILLALVLLL